MKRYSIFLILAALITMSCKNRRSIPLDSSSTSQASSTELFKFYRQKALNTVSGYREKLSDSLKASLCEIPSISPKRINGSNLLSEIDGISVKFEIDFAQILTKKTSPFSVKGGVEVSFWLPKDNTDTLKVLFDIIPIAGMRFRHGAPP